MKEIEHMTLDEYGEFYSGKEKQDRIRKEIIEYMKYERDISRNQKSYSGSETFSMQIHLNIVMKEKIYFDETMSIIKDLIFENKIYKEGSRYFLPWFEK